MPNSVRLETRKRQPGNLKKSAKMTWNLINQLGTRNSSLSSSIRSKNGLKLRVFAKMETRAVTRKERLISWREPITNWRNWTRKGTTQWIANSFGETCTADMVRAVRSSMNTESWYSYTDIATLLTWLFTRAYSPTQWTKAALSSIMRLGCAGCLYLDQFTMRKSWRHLRSTTSVVNHKVSLLIVLKATANQTAMMKSWFHKITLTFWMKSDIITLWARTQLERRFSLICCRYK